MQSDLRLAVRLLVRQPGFSAAAVLTLALGIGANTAIFSVVNAVLLRPAPFDDLDRLVMVWETDRNSGTTREPASVPDYLDYQAQSRTLETLAAVIAAQVNLAPPGGEPIRLAALRMTAGTLEMFGIRPLAGRHATHEETEAGATLALASDGLARRLFGGAEAAIGQTIGLDERPYTIVGVVPDASDFGTLQLLSAAAYARGFADRAEAARVDLWIPARLDPRALPRETHPLFMLARLAAGQTAQSAQRELEAIAASLEQQYPVNRGRGIHVEPLGEVVLGGVRPLLYILLGAVALVLLVACVNVAGLLLARGAGRVQEIAVRRALGASGSRVFRQFLAEGLVLTAVSSAAGLGLSVLAVQALVALAPASVPRLAEAEVDLRVLAVTLGVSVLVAVVFALVPALQARRGELQPALNEDGATRGTVGSGRSRLRAALVVGQLALAILLLAGAGLLLRSLWNVLAVDPGFRAGGVLKAEYQLPSTRYPASFATWPDFKEQHAFVDAILMRAAALPGVESAAVAGNHPLDPGFTNSFVIVGREAEARAAGWPELSVRRVTPGYFPTVGVGLTRGRLLEPRDSTRAPLVALINEAAAERFFPGRDPLGVQIRMYGAARTIVGVVANEKTRGLAEAPPLSAYLPLAQAPAVDGAGVLLVRARNDPEGLAAAVRGIFRERDPALAVFGVEALDRTVSRSVAARRFAALLLGVFAALALLLGAIGVHGVLAFEVARRAREIGIRMALGAGRAGILRMVVGRALMLTTVALVTGTAGAFALTRVLKALLFDVTPHDPVALTGAAAVLTLVALSAAAIPAWRAARVDPATALRT